MWTYSTINLVVTLGVFGAGVFGFAAGWLAHRAAVRERREAENEY